ncbi:hypothetical protein X798_06676 [Onchocerca flexuosa]|uniref:Calponin-homology (CH) domain-containing protein n=1 Tax=Onchocerca flexuosa TaxID=387005 RepID=A0A238BN92_9BILA|nr:hypothetical protein X798_06676 [Onchocerca flexuosa]
MEDIKKVMEHLHEVDNIYNSRTGVSLHFSPGTDASSTTMKKKLELLKKRYELQKTRIKKSSSSYDHISLHETEGKFLTSVSEIPDSINNHERNENTDVSLPFPFNTTINSISDSSKATNATYIVQPLVQTVEHNFVDRQAKTEMDKKSAHITALTSWLNFLLDEKNEADNSSEILAKSKKDAEQYLRKLLISGNEIPTVKNNESQNDIGYKHFMATSELSEMRARFRLLYKSSPIPNDIVNIVKSGKIAIRMDRRVYANIGNYQKIVTEKISGLQTELLSLLLSFHPFYLQLGLETILSINIGIRTDCKSQLKNIASVITQNIFKNPKIVNNRKYVQGKTKMLINDQGAEALLKHFLTKICQFLFIVDKAWRDNTISRKNRCLFVKWSVYKSINDVVVMLSRELMTGTSNLPKTLSRLGLFLDRKQGFFEQFQYHVTDLRKDLSDGLILGRTVEILANLEYNTVIHCLRDPGGDRLRKVSNIKKVIDFAKRKGILYEDLYVNIDGIVQGNIDEIISLLWRFVGKELGNVSESDNCDAEIDSISHQLQSLFGISYEIRNPLELADGKLFTLLWKQYYSYGTPFELFDGTTVLEQIANAAEYHFGIPSLMLVKWKNTPEEKTLCLFTKIFLSRIYEYHKLTCAAVTIQRAFRRYRTTSKFHGPDQFARSSELVAEEDSKRMKASITIQRYLRGWLARTFYQKIKYDKTLREREAKVIIIQKFIRGWLARTFYHRLLHEHNVRKRENASVIIQKHVRFWLAQKTKIRNDRILQKRENAACILQKWIRGWLARLYYRNLLHQLSLQKCENAAVTLQKHIRGWLARLHYRNLLHELSLHRRENATITLQRYARGWLIRKNYREMRHKAAVLKKEYAAFTLQRYARGWLIRKNYREMQRKAALSKKECAAITLQRYARGWLIRKNYREMQRKAALSKKECAAITLQRFIRGWLARLHYRNLRHELSLHKRENAAVILQDSTFVTEHSNDKFGDKIYGCEVISSAECLWMLRKLKKQHDRLRNKRQKFLQAVEDKVKLALLLNIEKDRRIKAATVIQAWWRGYLVRKQYMAIRNKVATNRVAHDEAISDEERTERMQPIIKRVKNAMKNLNSERLYIRYKATEVLRQFFFFFFFVYRKFVGLSETCAQYVFNNGGLECILDSLDGCNRGVGSTEVVVPLCSILWSLLKFKTIRNNLDDHCQQDIVRQCYHFMLAFHRAPNVVTDLSAVIMALDGKSRQVNNSKISTILPKLQSELVLDKFHTPAHYRSYEYEKAPYFIMELTKKFAKLPPYDKRVIALRKLQDCVLH